MKTENSVLMDNAEESLKGKWGLAIGTFLIYFFVIGATQVAIHFHHYSINFATIIISGPLAYGAAVFSLALSRNQDARFEQIFKGFDRFGITLVAYLLMCLYVILWALLLVIPGIIAAISYSMTFYILADDPAIGAQDAINKSIQMMKGYKWKYFCLCLRYILLGLLCILTLGVGFLWLIPYMHVGYAKFYDDVKETPVLVEGF